MPAEARVADASVLGALLFQEPRSAEAASLLADRPLFAPDLLAYELASIARKKAMRDPQVRDQIAQALRIGLALDIHWVSVDHSAVVGLALETGLTTYDASYLYVARSLEIPLVTFDEELARVLER